MANDQTEEQKRHEEVLAEQGRQDQRAQNEGIPGYGSHPEWADMTAEEIADDIESREGK